MLFSTLNSERTVLTIRQSSETSHYYTSRSYLANVSFQVSAIRGTGTVSKPSKQR